MRASELTKAMLSEPPQVEGIRCDGEYFPLQGYVGNGQERLFDFGEEILSYRELLEMRSSVVVKSSRLHRLLRKPKRKRRRHLALSWSGGKAVCPACGFVTAPGNAFWMHYNAAHAETPYWLNRSDWHKLFDSPYEGP